MERERRVFAQAAGSSNPLLSTKAFEAMGALRYRECIVPGRRVLGNPEAKRDVRTVAAAALAMLGDRTSNEATKAYLVELRSQFEGREDPGELADPTFARVELEKLMEAFINAPIPSMWTEELEKLARFKCRYLRKRLAELISETPHRDLLGVAKVLLKDGDPKVRSKAQRAVLDVENAMPETWKFLDRTEPRNTGK